MIVRSSWWQAHRVHVTDQAVSIFSRNISTTRFSAFLLLSSDSFYFSFQIVFEVTNIYLYTVYLRFHGTSFKAVMHYANLCSSGGYPTMNELSIHIVFFFAAHRDVQIINDHVHVKDGSVIPLVLFFTPPCKTQKWLLSIDKENGNHIRHARYHFTLSISNEQDLL